MGSLNDIYNDFFGSIERKNQRDLEKLTKELYGKDGKTPSWDDMPSSSEALRKAEEALAEAKKLLGDGLPIMPGEPAAPNGPGSAGAGAADPAVKGEDGKPPVAVATGDPVDKKQEVKKEEEDPEKELEELIGLADIKHDVRELADFAKVQKLRKEQGMKSVPVSLHLVFTGNPGTGKTTVARILGKLYKKIGILSKGQLIEVDRSGLVAGYLGQTAIKVQERIAEARGGILFIDEAYSLSQENDSFGNEAIDTLLKAMEDYRDDLIVIVAGYTEPMEDFINSNPGLKSRFNKYIEFPDYSVDELEAIFYLNCKKYEYVVEDKAKDRIRAMIIERRMEKIVDFANAREVRNMFEDIITNQARRVAALKNPKPGDLRKITLKDLEDTSAQEAAEKEAARVAKELEKVKGGKKKKSAKKAEEGGSPENGKEADAAEDKPEPEAEKPAEEKAQE